MANTNAMAMMVLISLSYKLCMILDVGNVKTDLLFTTRSDGTKFTQLSKTPTVLFGEHISFGNFIFNKRTLNASDVPSTHKDLVDPVWANKLALTIPHDDDAITYLFWVTIERYGWDWFDALQKQNVQWIQGTGEPADFLAAENTTRVLSSTNSLNGNSALASKTPNETRLLWPQTAAIFANTPRPESSKLFMSWSISDEYQQQFDDGGYYLARKDLHNELGSVWDDSLTPLTQFATFMENRDVVEWWRFQFETSLGTAQGVSPVLSEFGRRSSL